MSGIFPHRLSLAAVALLLVAGAGGISSAEDAALAACVEQAAAEAVRARIAAPDHAEVLSSRFTGADVVTGDGATIETVDVSGPAPGGTFRVRLRLLRDGSPVGEARASVRAVVKGPALVARRGLRMGSPIQADAVEVAERDLTALDGAPARDVAALAGRVPARTIASGEVITARLLTAAAVVRRGKPVELRVEEGALRVIAPGTARSDGAPGDVIAAVNPATRAVVYGVVQPDGSLRVVRGASRGRKR